MAGFKQPQNQSAPTPSVPQLAQTPQKPQSAAAIVGLVLGILAIVISWVPIVNNFAFIVGLIGLIFAIVGLTGTLRGKKRGRGIAIAALVVNILSVALVLGTQSLYGAALDSAINGPAASSTTAATDDTADGTSDDAQKSQDNAGENTDEGSFTNLAVGTPVELENGLALTVNSVQTGLTNFDGTTMTGVNVTYVNNSDSEVDYNSFNWKGEDAQGNRTTSTYYSEATSDLGYGSLAAGGTVTGDIYFEGEVTAAVYYASAFADSETASWKLA